MSDKGNTINQHAVAKLAGVSHATVSLVFSGHPRISEPTRKKVLEAAKKTQLRAGQEFCRAQTGFLQTREKIKIKNYRDSMGSQWGMEPSGVISSHHF
ncbi:helix-turn-helix domain-containing protein [Kamptonema cortianum]|nr:helix-turn-helix domain-containing protein [Kamptonema cortianum]